MSEPKPKSGGSMPPFFMVASTGHPVAPQ